MKKIANWEALVKGKNEKYEIAIPIPGCYISGHIEGKETILETSYIDLSSLTAMDLSNNYYQLGNAKESYLKILNEFIEFAKNKEKNAEKEI